MNERLDPIRWLLLLLTTALLPGCIFGRGDQDALYTLPEKARVLVYVNARSESGTPADVPAAMSDMIAAYLYQNRGADNLVGPGRTAEIQRTFGDRNGGLGNLVRAADATVVIYVDVLDFNASLATEEGEVTKGHAEALVKVADKDGKRLWPDDIIGQPVTADVEESFRNQQPLSAVKRKLIDLMALRVSRMFYKYSLDDKNMAR